MQHKGEDSFIAVENRSLSLLQSFVIRTTKIFPGFTQHAILITILSLILFWMSFTNRNNCFILFLSVAHIGSVQ